MVEGHKASHEALKVPAAVEESNQMYGSFS